jgi:signal transduction histidine kinase
MRKQTPIQFEYLYLPWNRWFERRVYPSPDALTVFVIEVTDRKQAEETLRQSEDRYRTLFESIDNGFCIIEVLLDETHTPIDYRFLEINLAFEKQTGLEQAVGETASQLIPGLENHWYEIYGRVALTGQPIRFEDGSEVMNRWFDVYACCIGQPESRKVAILFKDISDRKRDEAEREQLLQQEQAAREAAESANRIKDEFLAVLSHELRTPMNPILGWLKLLQAGKLNAEKATEAIATIERNAKLQVQLIDDLLDISGILRGKLSLTVAPVDLSDVITAALETVRLAAEAKSLSTRTLISPSVGLVGGDAGRLQQVVWNLLSNAVKFTPAGGQITVELSQVGTNAQIQVRDTGKGIDSQFLPHVFEHFRQEDGATTRKFGGLGLGLAIARQIVEMPGGHVAVESDGEGQGATFTIQIPIASRSADRMTSELEAELTLNLGGIHILVVDDDADSREFVAFVPEQAGAIVTMVSSGVEALQTIEQSVLHLIISDIGMPDMDGYSLMRQMRVTSQGRKTPAIALTAHAGEYDQQQAIAAGFQRHLAKPVEPEDLGIV